MSLPLLMAIVFLINLPFGYWRASQKRYSRGWFLAVRLPVPAIIVLRLAFGFSWMALPFTVLAFFIGQFTGGRTRLLLNSTHTK